MDVPRWSCGICVCICTKYIEILWIVEGNNMGRQAGTSLDVVVRDV
jgi:hypothetical protein